MKKSIAIVLAAVSILFANSCATVQPEGDSALLLIPVQSRTSAIVSQNASMTLSEKKGVMKFRVKTPYALVKVPATGELTVIEYDVYQRVKHFQVISFRAEKGCVTVFPKKLVAYTGDTSTIENLSDADKADLQKAIDQDKSLAGATLIWPDK